MGSHCDQCEQCVPFGNDAAILDSISLGISDLQSSRHLFPVKVKVDGRLICAGTPSRIEYLNGYRTARVFFLRPTDMLKYNAAYREMRRRAALMAKQQEQESS